MASSNHFLSPSDIPQRPDFPRTISSQSATSEISNQSIKSNRSSTSSRLHASLFPEKDKPRLYIGLYPRGGCTPTCSSQLTCDNYHWSLIVGSKSPRREELGKMYHIVHAPNDGSGRTLRYEETDLSDNSNASSKLLVRIAVAKVVDEERLEQLIRGIKIPHTTSLSSRPSDPLSSSSSEDEEDEHHRTHSSYTCLSFVQEAFSLLTGPPLSKKLSKPVKSYFSGTDWKDIEWRTRKYVKRKRDQGRFRPDGTRNYLLGGPATWNRSEVATWNFWENRETTD